jgi:hypothetical protein
VPQGYCDLTTKLFRLVELLVFVCRVRTKVPDPALIIMAPALIEKWRLHSEPGAFAHGPNGISSNRDLDPVPFESEERKWTWPSLLGFWIAEAFSISMYQVASSSITKGLSPGLAILAVVVGHILVCIPAMLNGYVGCIYGKLIDFPRILSPMDERWKIYKSG